MHDYAQGHADLYKTLYNTTIIVTLYKASVIVTHYEGSHGLFQSEAIAACSSTYWKSGKNFSVKNQNGNIQTEF